MISAMTGSWLIVKWIGIAVGMGYMALLVVVLLRFRGRLSQLRPTLILPVVIGSFVGEAVPNLFFENVPVRRACFVAASVIYVYGLATLARGLSQKGQKGLLKEDGAEDHIQPLKLS